jgi:hypothetical protein
MKVVELFEAKMANLQAKPSKNPKWTFNEIAEKYDLTKSQLLAAMNKFEGFPEKSLKKTASYASESSASYYDSAEVTKWYKKVLKLVGGDPKDFAKNIKTYKPIKEATGDEKFDSMMGNMVNGAKNAKSSLDASVKGAKNAKDAMDDITHKNMRKGNITMKQAFGSDEENALDKVGIDFVEKPNSWKELDENPISRAQLKKAEQALGEKIKYYQGDEIYDVDGRPKGPLVSFANKPKEAVCIVSFYDEGEDETYDYLIDTTQAKSYARMWRKIS